VTLFTLGHFWLAQLRLGWQPMRETGEGDRMAMSGGGAGGERRCGSRPRSMPTGWCICFGVVMEAHRCRLSVVVCLEWRWSPAFGRRSGGGGGVTDQGGSWC
jgi:hypothetical protein